MSSVVLNGDTSGAITIAAPAIAGANTFTLPATTGTGALTSQLGMRNRIINGAMVIDQRNAGASVTIAGGEFPVDRWACNASQTSKFSGQQNAGSVTPPKGFIKYLGLTSLSAYSITSGDIFNTSHNIEGLNVADLGWGTANAQTVTLSFWVRSSLTGTFGGALCNASVTRSYPFTYVISNANTWEYKTITIAGDTTGSWSVDNGLGIRIYLSLGTGSTKSGTAGAWAGADYRSATGATSVVGTNGATFYITGVQLEVGSSATGFEYRQYGQELALCQRYYWKWIPATTASWFFNSNNLSSGISYGSKSLPVSMRTSPTLSTSGTASDYQLFIGATPAACNAVPSINVSHPETPLVAFSTAGTLSVGGASTCGSATTNGFLGFSAEL